MQLALPAANHGDAHGFFVEYVLAFHSVSAHTDAVVGGEDDEGIVVHAAVFQSLDDASHMLVHSGDAGVVVADVFAEVVAFRSALFRNVGQLSGQCFHIERVVQPLVSFGHQFVARMRGIHRHHHGKGMVSFCAFRTDELDGAVGLVGRSPLVDVVEFLPSGFRIPVHRFQVIVVRAVSNPLVEPVATFRRTPFVPGHFSLVVVRIHVGAVRGIKVPLADVGRAIPFFLQHVAPAYGLFRKLHAVGGIL